MTARRIQLTVDRELERKIKKKAKSHCFKSSQDYILSIVRRDLFTKRSGGRPVAKTSDERIMDIISKPTTKTRKIENWARNVGL